MRICRILVAVAVLLSGWAFLSGAAEAPKERNPLLMGLASFIIPGLGQFLQGDTDKALTHLLIGIAIPVVGSYLAVASPMPGLVYTATAIAHLSWAIYSGVDSYRMAVEYNEKHGFSLRVSFTLALK